MGLRDLIQATARGWDVYKSGTVVDKASPVYQTVVEEFPAALAHALPGEEGLKFQGSTGVGNITAAPWIAVFDRSVTVSAQDGFYLVYLFATTLQTVTLTISFEVTQFTRAYGDNRATASRILQSVGRLQSIFSDRVEPRLTTAQPDLTLTSDGSLHANYQVSVVFSVPTYDVTALPPENQLIDDLRVTLKSYQLMTNDALLPSMDDLVAGSSAGSDAPVTPEEVEFVLRPSTQGKAAGGAAGGRGGQATGKTGRIGEELVYDHEQKLLHQAGRPDLASKVKPHFKMNEFVGWDITSFTPTGVPRRIEVKSTTGAPLNSVVLTANEWNKAQIHGTGFELCLVSKVLTKKPTFEYVVDPASYLARSQMQIEASAYLLRLGPSGS